MPCKVGEHPDLKYGPAVHTLGQDEAQSEVRPLRILDGEG